MIALHGSQAYVLHELSQLLATHGYATVALKYFDGPGLPYYLEDIPLEYFAKAIRWLTGKEQVQSTGIGLVGFSRGVEAALLAAVDYEGPATVIGYSGGGLIAPGVRGIPPREYLDKAAWTRNGTPIVQGNRVRRVFETVQEQVYQHRCNVESTPNSVRSKVPQRMLEDTLIPVEEIDGPVLLLTGSDDQQWPSPPVAALAIDRLQRRNHSSPYGLRTFCKSGHIFPYPYRDYTGEPTNDVNGGTPAANARAAATSWPLVARFLGLTSQNQV
ncbi:acyl-CoA thioester hydrolase/BAAT C-terminal domain-containing protein [Halococcus hamelinensis]|uniref:acyl-CoA thioester hydrolase/BAAT C-terminal domain-containing protein n=1 Tax=Halococcus hamelinensis TaxID=332168 RepID=UPI00373AF2E5